MPNIVQQVFHVRVVGESFAVSVPAPITYNILVGTSSFAVNSVDNTTTFNVEMQDEAFEVTVAESIVYNVTIEGGAGGGGGDVSSVFTRTGAVVAEVGDYDPLHLGQQAATNGQAVVWNDGTGQWEPGNVGGVAPVDSVFGRTGIVVATLGDYNTSQVTELTNLYFTDARVNANATVVANAAHAALVLGNPHNVTLADLGAAPVAHTHAVGDLTQSGATLNQALLWTGTAWAPVSLTTSLVSEGTNLYYTEARVSANVDVAANTAHRGASSGVHGITGAVVGTTDAQILTNKTLTAPVIGDFTNAGHTHANAAGGGTVSHLVLTNIGTYNHAAIDSHIDSVANPHSVTFTQAVAADIGTDITPAEAETLTDGSDADTLHHHFDFDYIDLTTGIAAPARQEGRLFWDDEHKCIAVYPPGSEVTHQVGQEMLYRVYNDTLSDIDDGQVVGTTGATGQFPNIAPVTAGTISGAVAVTTETIEAGTYGMTVVQGAIHGVDTSLWPVNTPLYLSPTVAGGMTPTIPDSPNYVIFVGLVLVQDAVDGVVYIHSSNNGNFQDIWKFFNGSGLLEATSTVTSTGSVVSLEYDTILGDPQQFIFNQVLTELSVPASVTLTAGTDPVPVMNYIYVLESTGVLTASTTGWPAAKHAAISKVFCQSAATILAQGHVYSSQSWFDVLGETDTTGHLPDINAWIRSQHATWLTGGAPSVTINTIPAPDDVYFDMAAGTMLQLHEIPFSAIEMSVADHVHVINDSVTPYAQTNNLNTILTDSAGGSLAGRYFSLVFLAAINDDGSGILLCNLPGGSYNSAAGAVADVSGFDDYSLPHDFVGTGLLIARVVFRHQPVASGTWTQVQLDDLRGSLIGTIGGGGGSSAVSSFSDGAFDVYNATDPTKVMAFDISAITTATTRTYIWPDASGTVALTSDLQTAHANRAQLDLITDGDHDVIAAGNPHSVTYTEVGAAALVHTHVVSDLTQSGATTGQVIAWNGSIWAPAAAGAAPVDSVFGRTGIVVAAANDYTWAQIDKTVSDLADLTTKSHTSLTDIGTNTHAQIDTHIGTVAGNPHAVTLAEVGGAAASHTHAPTDITQGGATSNQALLWTGVNWVPTSLTTTLVTEGTNLYYTEARVTANTTVAANAVHAALTTGNPHNLDASDVGAIGTILNGITADLIETTTPPTTNRFATESIGGSMRWAQLGNLPISTLTQAALDDKAANTKVRFIYIKSPTATDVYPVFKANVALTITKITGYTDAGTVTFDLEERNEGTPDTAGTAVNGTAMLAFTTMQTDTSFSNPGIDADDWVVYVAASHSTATELWVAVHYTED